MSMNQKDFIEIEQRANELGSPAAKIILILTNEVKELASKVGKAFSMSKKQPSTLGYQDSSSIRL